MNERDSLHAAQLGLGDMDPAEFRAAAHRVADMAADYLERVESYPVLPDIEPGSVRAQVPAVPPSGPESLETILADYLSLVEPNITHWQHPGWMAYFCSVASGPGILGEWLAATLNSNVMLWRNAPASTEIEEVVVQWLREMMGLPTDFDGMFTDTASVSTLLSVVAARHAVPGLDARDEGLAGREGLGRLRLYCSSETHSSIEKAAIVAGIGRAGVRAIPVDEAFAMRAELLGEAIREDRQAGRIPVCAVATLGTTSTTSVDPVAEIARICRDEKLWLHVDAAYAGAAALASEMRPLLSGWEHADSIVVNPHKWLFTPFDASLLLFKNPELYREAFSLVPEYLSVRQTDEVHNFHEYGIQLGRRFRALKLWFMIRYFGAKGMADRIRESCRLAARLRNWIEETPDWEMLAPTPFSTLCLRFRPAALDPDRDLELLNTMNERIMSTVNASGKIFLSHTMLHGAYTIRVTLGNPRATEKHVALCWSVLQDAAAGAGA